MKISCANVVGGWITVMYPADGGEYTFGPVYNMTSDLPLGVDISVLLDDFDAVR